MEHVQLILSILEIILTSLAIIGALYSFYKWVVNPLRKKLFVFCSKIDKMDDNISSTKERLDKKVIPFIDSFQKEFSTNSGKSLKDQIARIDNNTRLAELRSKLVTNSLLTTGVFECDENGECIWVNKACCELFGMSFEEMLGKGWLSGIMEEERTEVWEKWIEDISYGIPYEAIYHVVNRKTGENIKCKASTVTHKTVDGKILGYYGTILRV